MNLWKKLNEVIIHHIFLPCSENSKVILSLTQGVYIVQSTDDEVEHVNMNDPWSAFIHSELTLGKKVFKTIHQTLIVMHAATKDITSINKDDLNMMKIICENQVPLIWRKLWSGPRLLTDYLRAVACRGIEANNRFNNEKNIEFGERIDFAKIFNIESFLAALKLRNAR